MLLNMIAEGVSTDIPFILLPSETYAQFIHTHSYTHILYIPAFHNHPCSPKHLKAPILLGRDYNVYGEDGVEGLLLFLHVTHPIIKRECLMQKEEAEYFDGENWQEWVEHWRPALGHGLPEWALAWYADIYT